MALSNSINYTTTRDDIIKRALRIVGALGQGETPPAQAVTEASQALNDITKEWQADGMQLWKRAHNAMSGTISAGVSITLGPTGTSSNVTGEAPLKILDAWYRNTTTSVDVPLNLITKNEYDKLPNKGVQGTPTQLYYDFLRSKSSSVGSGNSQGVLYLYPAMSSTFIAANTIYISGVYPLYDFDSSSDQPDVPDYLVNALVWGLADQLAYEYGLGPVEKSQIEKKAMKHKAIALSFDQEEGSLFLFPDFNRGG